MAFASEPSEFNHFWHFSDAQFMRLDYFIARQ